MFIDQVVPEIGITATPVIDLTASPHGTIYVVAMSKNATSYFQRMHALDLTTGAEQFGGRRFGNGRFLIARLALPSLALQGGGDRAFLQKASLQVNGPLEQC